jgi:RNA polymerase sigma-54 factor
MNRMELRQNLGMALRQRLILSPALQQSIELLQLPSVELEKLIEAELAENPLLEAEPQAEEPPAGAEDEDPEPTRSDATEDHLEFLAGLEDYAPSYSGVQEEPWRPEPVRDESLADHLLGQVYDLRLDPDLEEAVRYVIYSLDRHGLLSLGREELGTGWEGDPALLDRAVAVVQGLEPRGAGCFSVREAILLQLDDAGSPADSLERRLVRDHFDELPGTPVQKLARLAGATPVEIQEAMDGIRRLNPYPGAEYMQDSNTLVIPDIFFIRMEGRYIALMNDSRFPALVISERNRRIIESPHSPPEEKEYVREKYKRASLFLRSIEQRQQTVRRIGEFLAEHQAGFFDQGVEALRPLTLQQVGDALGYNQSTISRAINGKYAESPQGVHEMRFFFSRSLPESGDISTRTAKEELKRLVEMEDPSAPLSDDQLAERLRNRGLAVKRRTVANYRTQMGIPPANRRKRFRA